MTEITLTAVRPGTPALDALLARIGEGAALRERERIAPHAEIALLREARLGALRLPVADGGGGASMRQLFEAVIALSSADPNVAQALRAHFGAVEEHLDAPDGPRRRRWLERYARGELVGNAATEPGARNPGDPKLSTILEARGDGFVLNGVKHYCTGTPFADHVLVTANTPDRRSAVAIVPTDRPGVTVSDDWDGFGQRLSGTGTTVLEDVAVAADEVAVADPETAREGATRWPYSPFFQHYLNAVVAGIVRAIRDDAAALLAGRARGFTHGAAPVPREDPVLLEVVGELSAAAAATEAIVLHAAEALAAVSEAVAAGAPSDAVVHEAARRTSQAQVVVDELGLRAASSLFDAGSGSAVREALNLDRHWRNVRTLASHNPARLKSRALGDLLVNGTALPDNTYF